MSNQRSILDSIANLSQIGSVPMTLFNLFVVATVFLFAEFLPVHSNVQEIIVVILLSVLVLKLRHVPSKKKQLPTKPPKLTRSQDLKSMDDFQDATGHAIHTAARLGDAAKAESLMEEALGEGCQPSVACYCAVIKALAKAGEVQRAYQWLQQLADSKSAPLGNRWSYEGSCQPVPSCRRFSMALWTGLIVVVLIPMILVMGCALCIFICCRFDPTGQANPLNSPLAPDENADVEAGQSGRGRCCGSDAKVAPDSELPPGAVACACGRGGICVCCG